jgi:hypothetical protein
MEDFGSLISDVEFSCSPVRRRPVTQLVRKYRAHLQAAGQAYVAVATRHDGAWGERRYSSYSFLTSTLDGVSGPMLLVLSNKLQ